MLIIEISLMQHTCLIFKLVIRLLPELYTVMEYTIENSKLLCSKLSVEIKDNRKEDLSQTAGCWKGIMQ